MKPKGTPLNSSKSGENGESLPRICWSYGGVVCVGSTTITGDSVIVSGMRKSITLVLIDGKWAHFGNRGTKAELD